MTAREPRLARSALARLVVREAGDDATAHDGRPRRRAPLDGLRRGIRVVVISSEPGDGHRLPRDERSSYADRPVPVVDPSALLDEVYVEYRAPQTEAEWEALCDDFDAVGPWPKRESTK